MFTGIVEELGTVAAVDKHGGGARLTFLATKVLTDATLGASIAVNGCCLTVVEHDDASWTTDAQVETLMRSTLGDLKVGDRINLERPVRLSDRLSGHVVQGHVDGVAEVLKLTPESDGSTRFALSIPKDLARYVVEKGSVTFSGVSLTVAKISGTQCDVALIPHTLAQTTFGTLKPGDRVNIEVDVLAKYVESLLSHNSISDQIEQ